jgi:hypothetical protein
MSPLADEIYRILVQRVGLAHPLLTYQELVQELPRLDPPYDGVTRNDDRLFKSLGEVGRACQDLGLPTLTALVIRSIQQSPGSGYYSMFHPAVGNDLAKQKEAWEGELGRVRSTTYPPSLDPTSTARPDTHADDRQKSRPIGDLRIADGGLRPTMVFTGHIKCARCSSSVKVEVERNASAVLSTQPAFIMVEAGATPRSNPIGHLFIGTILSSPVLYYGSMNHCGSEQRIAVFYNRALRDRSDHHLTVMPSTSTQ